MSLPVQGQPGGQAPAHSYRIATMGVEQGPMGFQQLAAMAAHGALRPTDVVSQSGGPWVPATMIPGLFSDKQWVTAMLLSFFLGGLGIDRFYLGYTGLGIAKLLVGWLTLGIWPLVDFILICCRKVPDADGRPLS